MMRPRGRGGGPRLMNGITEFKLEDNAILGVGSRVR